MLDNIRKLADEGALAPALDLLRSYLAVSPPEIDELLLLASLELQAGILLCAREAANRALTLNPSCAEAHFLLGRTLLREGDQTTAIQAFEAAISADPHHFGAWANLASTCRALGLLHRSIEAYRHAIGLRPENARTHFNLANALQDLGASSDACSAYREAIRIDPHLAEAWNNLGSVLLELHRMEDAEEALRRALTLAPDSPLPAINMAQVFLDSFRVEEGIHSLQQTCAQFPDSNEAETRLLWALHFSDRVEPATIVAQHRRWGRNTVHRLETNPIERAALIERSLERARRGERIRVGYISADLRRHPVGFFMRGILAAHDRNRCEVLCFSNTKTPDQYTREISTITERWCDIAWLDDITATSTIRAYEPDILVDLSGHTAGQRLGVFARRAAPVQATYLGYPDITGLHTIDYRIVDRITDPPIETDSRDDAEALAFLPEPFLCYSPPSDAPLIGERPDAPVTFGSANKIAKITGAVVEAWSQIISRVPGSRLLLKSPSFDDPATQNRIRAAFESQGMQPDRLSLEGSSANHTEHLAWYRHLDIALDPWPYNGTTTTCEALWMGVPVVTLCGHQHSARVGATLLPAVGLPDLVAASVEEYIAAAHTLADDFNRRRTLRQQLRSTIGARLSECAGFTKRLENLYAEWISGLRSEGADEPSHR